MQDNSFSRPTLRDLLFILFRYRWVAIGSFLVVLAAGITMTLRTPKVYESRTRIFVGTDVKQLRLNQSDTGTRINLEQLLGTEAEIARSLTVVEAAVQAAGPDPDGKRPSASQLMSSLQVVPVRNTSLLEFRLSYTNAEYAASLLNHLVDAYLGLRTGRSLKTGEADQYSHLLADINSRIDSMETVIASFYTSHEISKLDRQIDSELNRRADLMRSRDVLEREQIGRRQEQEALVELLADFSPERIPDALGVDNVQVRNWLTDYFVAQRDRLERGALLQDDSPEIERLDSRMMDQRRKLEELVRNVADQKQREIDARQAELATIDDEIANAAVRSQELATAGNRSTNLQLQLADLHNIRTVLVRQLEEARIRSGDASSLRLEQVDEAQVPITPIKPNVLFNLVTTLLVAFVLGVGLPLYMQLFSSSIVNDYDMARLTGLPVLCNVREA